MLASSRSAYVSIYTASIVRILVVATKTPWPPADGGRLVLWLALQGLAQAGHEIALVAPVDASRVAQSVDDQIQLRTVCQPNLVEVRHRSFLTLAVDCIRRRRPFSLSRHASDAVRDAAAEQIRKFRPDVIHAEQLQSLANCDADGELAIPLLLRMQNVESDLWTQVSRTRWWRRCLAIEGWRLQQAERRAIAGSDQIVTLTSCDADALRVSVEPSDAARICCVPPTFAVDLPAAPAVSGYPALVLAGSGGWWPNTQGTQWFLDAVWPKLQRSFPAVRLHQFGGEAAACSGVRWHPAPTDSGAAFPRNAIVIVPLHVASGIRMRILEAWARGVPVVATTVAARGLMVESFRELIIADTADQYIEALRQLMSDDSLPARLVSNGRAYLRQHHQCGDVTRALLAAYERAVSEASLRMPEAHRS